VEPEERVSLKKHSGRSGTRSNVGLKAALILAVVMTLCSAPSPASGVVAAARPDLGPFPTTTLFVRQQFADLLDRPPTDAELRSWTGKLRGDLVSGPVALDRIAHLPGAADLAGEVTRIYQSSFNRLPDVGGWQYWLGQRRSGLGLAGIAGLFAGSPEFRARYGMADDDAFVRLVYLNVLGRQPDPGGLAFWKARLSAGFDRGSVMVGFSESAESRARSFDTTEGYLAFAALLDRVPTTDELSDLASFPGDDPFAAAAGPILGGAEYAALHPEAVATTYQGNALHDGNQPIGDLPTTLKQAWRATFDDIVSHPLIAGGRVFVTVRGQPGSVYGNRLYALDAEDGAVLWGPVPVGRTYSRVGIAFGDQRVYAIDFDGMLQAYSAETGEVQWSSVLPGQGAFTSSPTAFAGMVYVGGAGVGGTLYAVDGATGALAWTAPVANGDQSAAAVDATGVYVSYACLMSYRFDRATGANVWTHSTDCSGGGGRTPVLNDGRLYVRDSAGKTPVVLDAATGEERATFASDTTPAFDGPLGFVLSQGLLQCVTSATGQVRWTRAADGELSTAPITVGNRVYVGSRSGRVHAFDQTLGNPVWSADVGSPILAPDERNAEPLVGMAAGNGLLVVPATNTLVAFG
jgi:outer membrane protein assembly factor BamB